MVTVFCLYVHFLVCTQKYPFHTEQKKKTFFESKQQKAFFSSFYLDLITNCTFNEHANKHRRVIIVNGYLPIILPLLRQYAWWVQYFHTIYPYIANYRPAKTGGN